VAIRSDGAGVPDGNGVVDVRWAGVVVPDVEDVSATLGEGDGGTVTQVPLGAPLLQCRGGVLSSSSVYTLVPPGEGEGGESGA
jgi:hypothetical protein